MAKRPIHIAASPLTNRIFAGHMLKDGRSWAEGKQDVTGLAIVAVCQHVLESKEPTIVLMCNDTSIGEINTVAGEINTAKTAAETAETNAEAAQLAG